MASSLLGTGVVRRAVVAEWRRVFASRGWWLYPAGALGWTAVALWANIGTVLSPSSAYLADREAMLLTSGQHYGQLLAMLFGALLVTADLRHRTIGPALLAVPDRRAYAVAKLRVAAQGGLGLGGLTLVLTLPIGSAVLAATGHPFAPGLVWGVVVDLVGFPLWSLLGASLAMVVRSQPVMVALVLGPYAVSYLLAPLITDPAWGFWPLVLPALGSLQEATAVNNAVGPVEASSIALMGLGGYTIAVVPSGVGRLSTLDVT